MKVLIGTKNPGKIEGARKALSYYFKNVEIIGVKAESNVSDQPVNRETFEGAKNRVNNLVKYAKENHIEADLFMAVESGLTEELGFWQIINVAAIKDKNGNFSFGTSAGFPVPKKHVQTIIDETLATVMDNLFNESDLRSSTGGVGLLTHDVITRIDLNTQAFVMALTKFINGYRWDEEDECTKQ
ncbi:MAG: DUF84 family protein [Clostridiales bacterium]|nr:DUF84 family protein [Clostridiales bacterium]